MNTDTANALLGIGMFVVLFLSLWVVVQVMARKARGQSSNSTTTAESAQNQEAELSPTATQSDLANQDVLNALYALKAEMRLTRNECEKIKWAARSIAVMIALFLLGGFVLAQR